MHSISWKMNRAYQLASNLCFAYGEDGYAIPRDTHKMFGKEDNDLLWAWADQLVQKQILKRINGECSLREMLEFDMDKLESELDKTIEHFVDLHYRVGIEVPKEREEESLGENEKSEP